MDNGEEYMRNESDDDGDSDGDGDVYTQSTDEECKFWYPNT